MANIEGNLQPTTSSKFNFTLSMYAEFSITDNLAIQPEIMFSGQGFKFIDDDGTGFTGELKQKLNYTNVPLLLNFYFSESFFLQAGPYVGFLNSAKENVTGTLGIFGGPNTDEFKSLDNGMIIGAHIRSEKVTFGVRYLYGVINISEVGDANNRVLNIALGYRFIDN